MKKIVIYQCEDGTRFDEEIDAARYEDMSERLSMVERLYLGVRDEKKMYAKEPLRHDLSNVMSFKENILKAAAEYIPKYKKLLLECASGSLHISHAQRIIGDYNLKMFDEAFFRLNCIDMNTGIEYTQPYYASHPEEWIEFYDTYFRDNKDHRE